MTRNDDILGNLDIAENSYEEVLENPIFFEETAGEVLIEKDIIIQEESIHTITTEETQAPILEKKQRSFGGKILGNIFFLMKYFASSICIFGVLLLVTNYSAYWNIVHSMIYAEEMEHTKKSLIESVAAANISETSEKEDKEVNTFKQLEKQEEKTDENKNDMHSISQLITQTNTKNIDLGIEITPYENRIVIPKIGKNIPLIDIAQTQVTGVDELNNIFMEELENGVIRYPGSALPGQDGNAFVFGHSSNFPWIEGEYNDVFALLDKVVFDDEVVVYYGQEKYTYKIRTKNVIRPGDVSVLKSNEKGGSQITLMTCWPIGTTLNRLVLTGDLIEVTQ